MQGWVGIDVAKATLAVVLLREGDEQATEVPNTPKGFGRLHRFIEKRCPQGAHSCLEATGLYGDAVAEYLLARGYRLSVVNPVRIKAYGDSRLNRNKTDHSDARLIAHFCRTQQPEAWTPLPAEVKELRAMLRHLDDLQAMHQQEHNRLQAGVQSPTIVDHLRAHLAFLDAQIAALKQQIHDHFDQHPHLKQQRDLLTSIPGIGDLTAGRLLAEIGDIHAFASARQLAAFVGLTPRQYRSGSSVHRPSRISKQGNSALRAALFFPAIVAQQHNPILAAFAHRLRQRGHAKMSIVVAVMRKLVHLVFGILISGQPFDPLFLDKRATAA
jgi:transposase